MKPVTEPSERYLVDDPDPEGEAVRRLFELPAVAEQIFHSLGLEFSLPGSWYILKIKTDRLVDSVRGDIDILGGRRCWKDPNEFERIASDEMKMRPHLPPSLARLFATSRLVEADGIEWPPPMDYLVAIEAKCSVLRRDAPEISRNTVKTKSSPSKVRRLRVQLERLLRMGFDRVALLDVIANPPASGEGFQAFVAAGGIASLSSEAVRSELKSRLPPDSPVDHWVLSWGSVVGGDERRRGAPALLRLRVDRGNPWLQTGDQRTRSRRVEMEKRLRVMLGNLPPRQFVLTDCRSCGEIHGIGVDHKQ